MLYGQILVSLWSLFTCMGISLDVETFSLTSGLKFESWEYNYVIW